MPTSIAEVEELLGIEQVVVPSSPSYAGESRTWAAQEDLNPRLIARPATLESLARLIALLGDSGLDFKVRCGGVGSASAKDVLVSLAAFDSFEFDQTTETITIGAGQVWGEVDRKMEEFAPGYAGMALLTSA
jgi:FAD/FMN-containing dehydrogenase